MALTSLLLLGLATPAYGLEHQVQSGDSLWSLARKYGVAVEALQAANKLGPDGRIRAGQRLEIPVKTQAPRAKTSERETKVEAKTPLAAAKTSAPKAAPPAAVVKPKGPESALPVVAAVKTPAPKAAPAVVAVAKTPPAPKAASVVVAVATTSAATAKPVAAPAIAPTPKATSLVVAPAKAPEPAPVAPAVLEPQRLPPISAAARARAEVLYQAPRAPAENSLDEVAPEWVLKRPGAETQGEKPNAARGGVYPCAAPDPGFGAYRKWVQIAPIAHVLAPKQLTLGENSSFDLVVHFHGREPIRKEWVRVMQNTVLVAIDVGIDSEAYRVALRDPRTIGLIVRAAEQAVAAQNGVQEAHARHVGLSAWSAGYGGVEAVLSQPFGRDRVDSLVLLDGLHAGYAARSLATERMQPFVQFADAAARGDRLMFVSHSSLIPQGYASTTETANYLIWKVGGKPQPALSATGYPMGLERIATFNEGDFHVRGFRGSGSADHCAHIALMRDVLRVHLKERYEAPPPAAENVAVASHDVNATQ